MNAILEARDMLRELTPLLTDCGELCNHACCKMDRDAGGLVWLWPARRIPICPGPKRCSPTCP